MTPSGGPVTYTLDPIADFAAGETCTGTLQAAWVSDLDTNDPPNNMLADYNFTFTIDSVEMEALSLEREVWASAPMPPMDAASSASVRVLHDLVHAGLVHAVQSAASTGTSHVDRAGERLEGIAPLLPARLEVGRATEFREPARSSSPRLPPRGAASPGASAG
jgi:hypothetical protein